MPIADADLNTLEHKLTKRGFRQADLYHHECPSCHENAVRIYGPLRDPRYVVRETISWRTPDELEALVSRVPGLRIQQVRTHASGAAQGHIVVVAARE